MAINFPGPLELRIFYTTDENSVINDHVLRHSLAAATAGEGDPGDPFSAWTIQLRGGTTTPLDDWTDALMILIDDFYASAVDFTHAELWKYQPSSFDATYQATYALGLSGTSGGATVDASQGIITFRTAVGGVAKIDLRGISLGAGPKQSFPTAAAIVNALASFLSGSLSAMIGRDGGFLVAPIFWLPGQNERAWKRVNR